MTTSLVDLDLDAAVALLTDCADQEQDFADAWGVIPDADADAKDAARRALIFRTLADHLANVFAVVRAAREMPRATLGSGSNSTVFDYPIASWKVWGLDAALTRLDGRPRADRGAVGQGDGG